MRCEAHSFSWLAQLHQYWSKKITFFEIRQGRRAASPSCARLPKYGAYTVAELLVVM